MSAPAMQRLDPALEARLRRHLEARYPAEGCGALIGRGDGPEAPWVITDIGEAPNAHAGDQNRRYLVPPQFQLQVERAARSSGQDVIGYYHSHPDHPARPSEHDRELAWPGYIYVIYSVAAGVAADLRAFALNDAGEFMEIAVRNREEL